MSYGQQRYTKKEYIVDPNLYEDYELSHNDVPEELGFLVPVMERLERGELVDVHDLPNGTYCYLMDYYSSKHSKPDPSKNLFFMYEIRNVNGEPHELGYLSLPTVTSPVIIQKRNDDARKMERKRKVLKWFQRYWWFRTFIKLFI